MKLLNSCALALATSLLLLGCSSHSTKSGHGAGFSNNADSSKTRGMSDMDSLSASDGGLSTLSTEATETLKAMNKKVHFAYNRYDLDTDNQAIAKDNANFLLSHTGISVLLAGHADPRGSQEYNFHLGERRANTVKTFLLSEGVTAQQICTISYGDLKPAASPEDFGGNWHKAYALDRRAEFTYGQSCQQGQDAVQGAL